MELAYPLGVVGWNNPPEVRQRGILRKDISQMQQQNLKRRAIVGNSLSQGFQRVERLIDQRKNQRNPIGEMAIKRRAPDPGARDDQIERRGDAMFQKDCGGSLKQCLAMSSRVGPIVGHTSISGLFCPNVNLFGFGSRFLASGFPMDAHRP
nr:hypothetical protein [Sphingobium sp. AntQ-1]